MQDDDIDWMNAASDFGLVALCREMELLAGCFQATAALAAPRRKLRRNGAAQIGRPVTKAAAALLYQ